MFLYTQYLKWQINHIEVSQYICIKIQNDTDSQQEIFLRSIAWKPLGPMIWRGAGYRTGAHIFWTCIKLNKMIQDHSLVYV